MKGGRSSVWTDAEPTSLVKTELEPPCADVLATVHAAPAPTALLDHAVGREPTAVLSKSWLY